MELQLQHSSKNTPAMMERGKLIRDIIPGEMREWAAAQAAALLPYKGHLKVQGRDGTGPKTLVPWVRIYSPEMSPSAQRGWYVVYLFRADGKGVSLCISHGSTEFDGRDFKPRSAIEAAQLMTWARGLLGPQASQMGMTEGVNLGPVQRLAKAYMSTTAFSKAYEKADLPNDAVLAADAARAVNLIGKLYRAQQLGFAPFSEPPEVVEAIVAIENVTRPASNKRLGAGQGFGSTRPSERLLRKEQWMRPVSGLVQTASQMCAMYMPHSHVISSQTGMELIITLK